MTQQPSSTRRFIFINGRGSSGKDTQADRLVAENPSAIRISTGDIFRDAQNPQHEVYGKFHDQIQPYVESVNKGGYLPDEVILPIVDEVINDNVSRGKDTFIFTGFPRTAPQLKAVDAYIQSLRDDGKSVTADYVCFAVLEQHSVRRAEGRRTMALQENTPVRIDDDPATVQRRLETYKKLTEPMLKILANEGRLHIIKSKGTIEEVEERLKRSLGKELRGGNKEQLP